MIKELPGQQSWLAKTWNGVKKTVSYWRNPTAYSAQIMADAQRDNNQNLIKYYEERDELQKEIEAGKIKFQAFLQETQLAATAEQGELNRQLQTKLAQLNQQFQAKEGQLNRELQTKLAQLNQQFLAQEGKLNRENALQLEHFRAELQKYLFTQQRELQLQLKALDAELARELRLFDRQTSLEVIKEQKRLNNSPIWLIAEDILSANNQKDPIPLRVFFSPPALRHDRQASPTQNFPDMEQYLGRSLREFFAQYSSEGRPIEFLAGAWTSKFFHSEAAVKAIFGGLKTEPAMILESAVEGDIFEFNFAFWGGNWSNYRYQNAISFSWIEVLYDLVKLRSLNWGEKRDNYLTQGKPLDEFYNRYGKDVVNGFLTNLEIWKREQECLEEEEDPSWIERPYRVLPKDYDALKKLIANYHCLFAGILADEYFLLHVPQQVRFRPLLPQLLPQLIENLPEKQTQDLLQSLVRSYETMYLVLERDESGWIPELKLDLALSLSHLPNQFGAKEQLNQSLTAWLNQRLIPPTGNLLDSVSTALTQDDLPYVEKLNQCLATLGETQQLNVETSCYQRGLERYQAADYQGALIDLDMVIEINPQSVSGLYLRGLIAIKLEEDEWLNAALDDLSAVLAINPNHQHAYRYRGGVFSQLGYYPQAIADLNRAIELGSNGAVQKLEIVKGVWREIQRQGGQEKPPYTPGKPRRKGEISPSEKNRRSLLPTFDFETVKVDSKGQIIQRLPGKAEYLRLDLGNEVYLDLVKIPAGKFPMGSPDHEEYHQSNESPQHEVSVPQFFLGKYPVTQLQWEKVMGDNPSHFKGPNRPVENVSWNDCVNFCKKVAEITKKDVRLASEAEWEYACRAGTTTPFYFGETITPEIANYNGNSTYGSGPKGTYRQQTTDVGSFHPNAFGLYDMHGNVLEWCNDNWHENYLNAPQDGSAWAGGDASYRVLRGGYWNNDPRYCRAAYRLRTAPDYRGHLLWCPCRAFVLGVGTLLPFSPLHCISLL